MPALVNFGGENDLCSRDRICSKFMDSGRLLSLAPCLDVYCPPRKRSRVTAPYVRPSEGHKAEKRCSIDVLPDECLFEIFRRLPGEKEKSISASVSKRWLFLLSSIRSSEVSVKSKDCVPDASVQSMKKPLPDLNGEATEHEEQVVETKGHLTRCLEGKEATDTRLASIAVCTAGCGGLGKLSIHGSKKSQGVTDLGLTAIARGCPSLTVLSMWDVPSVSDKGLIEIANGCFMLEKLDLFNCPMISDKGLTAVAQKCPNLTTLSIESCSRIGNEGLKAIGRSCPKLESVAIKDCALVGDQGVAGLVSAASSTLTDIKLHKLNISDLSLAVVGHYGRSLINLVISSLHNVSERGFWVMGNTLGLQKLKSFVITSCPGVTDIGLGAIAKGSPCLKHLCLRNCCTLSDVGLKAFAGAAGALEHLQLEECSRITLVGVLGALQNLQANLKTLSLSKCEGVRDISFAPSFLPCCMSLRSLTICDCPGFSSSSLAVVGQICPKLRHLDLSGLVGVTDAGLLPLIESSHSRFVKVNLSGCVNVTDLVISALAKAHGETLQYLHLSGCKKVSDASLLAIAESCSVMSDLDVSKSMITDYGVAALASARQFNLEILSLSSCSRVTRRSLPFLVNMGRSLVGLNLQYCNMMNTNGIGSLEEKLWWCDILS